ncbi:MAG: T9SS type A sorting domain-containing protein [Bacteroidia bacterium]
MKHCLFALLLALTIVTSLPAQWVTIPDANLATWLQTNHPTCMSGNQMDTTCVSIATANLVNVENKGIADLTGIQYFDSLKLLNCRTNQITSLPRLPSRLITLQADGNQLSSLPALPSTMLVLTLGGNQFASLPPLPAGLTSLYVGQNPITSFPTFPAGLQELDLQGCNLTTVPPLPANLRLLFLANNPLGVIGPLPPALEILAILNVNLTVFPTLPSTLKELNCAQNNLTAIPGPLPAGLTHLSCEYNNLTSLPALPSTLEYLVCMDNDLTSLPTLPGTLAYLDCFNNQLTSLPALPNSLGWIRAYNNQITYLPTLPAGLTSTDFTNNQITCFAPFPQPNTINLNVTNNPFTCLPNLPNWMNPPASNYTICGPGNTFGCQNGEGVGGYVYDDQNADCIRNGVDPGAMNAPVKLYDNLGGFAQAASTHPGGMYFFTAPIGTWTAKIDTAGKPYTVTCPAPGIDSTVNLVLGTQLIQGVNFEVECKPGFDIGSGGVSVNGMLFPGQPFTTKALAGDMSTFYGLHCATGVAGTVTFSINGPVTYVGPAPGAMTPTISGNDYIYTVTDFGAVNPNIDFALKFTTLTTATTTDTICFDVVVTPTVGDQHPGNNVRSLCLPVRNSLDPNAKEVSPAAVAPGYADWLTYTIHFQNTGNAPAINIRLEDTLDARFDLGTFEYLDASHYNTWVLDQNRLTVHFPNIMLADSASDPAGSQGNFMFRIRPKANQPLGSTLPNSAAIYFDFNPPVITNTATVDFNVIAGRPDPNATLPMTVFPNPSNGVFHVSIAGKSGPITWQVVNAVGQVAREGHATNPAFKVDLGEMPRGIYLLQVQQGGLQEVRRLILD